MIGILILSHSSLVAEGAAAMCSQIASNINIDYAGGVDGRLGIDGELALNKLNDLLADNEKVVLYADIGSTVLTAKSIKELSNRPENVYIVNAPLVEGSIAGSVEVSLGSDINKIMEESKKACFIEKS